MSSSFSPGFSKIDQILDDSLLNKGETGINIISAMTGETLFKRNANKFFPPASGLKLVTTAGALFFLKHEFRFKTLILSNGKVVNDTLKGDILMVGKGDPTLDTETFFKITKQLKTKGINLITGDILFDDSYFDTILYGKGWMWDDLEYEFSAPISALSVNGNTCKIFVKPGRKTDDALDVYIEPQNRFITIINKGTTGEGNILSVTTKTENNRTTILVNGSLTPEAKQRIFIRSMKKPSLYAASLFAEILKDNGIAIKGEVRRANFGTFADTLLIHTSEPLTKILYDMDKESSNFIAEMTLKTIGAEMNDVPGTSEKGIKAIASTIKDLGITKRNFHEVDGSGLSRYNLISPEVFTSLLFYLYHTFEYAPEFLTVLPTSGIDGTLKNRMKEEDLRRKVRAKTGTMTGASTLSGYCITDSGKILIFSIMMKDYIASPTYVRNLQDQILKILVGF